jgi:hypothetical protein
MAVTTAGELRNIDTDDLVTKLREAKEELFNLRFQAATREQIRIAAHQPHHRLARTRPGDQQLGQLGQGNSRFGGGLALVNNLSGLGGAVQQFRVDPRVTDHHVCAAQQFRAPQRQQAGITGPSANKIDNAFWFHRSTLYALSYRPAMEQADSKDVRAQGQPGV